MRSLWILYIQNTCYVINSYKSIDESGIFVFSCKDCNFKTPLKSCFERHLNIAHKKNILIVTVVFWLIY